MSTFDHFKTSLGNFKNTPIAVGGYGTKHDNKKVEQHKNGVWTRLEDLPIADTNIFRYSMVTFNEELYLFGRLSFHLKFSIQYSLNLTL